MQQKRWTFNPKSETSTAELEEKLGLSKELVELLHQREVTTFEEAQTFFRPQMSHIHDPLLMKDMDKAIERIHLAQEKNEGVMIFGDYDVDGTTSVALAYSFFKEKFEKIDYYIPDRYKEGYGISNDGIDYAKANGLSLIIALDCGIKSIDHVAYAKERNIDFIICDHHRPGEFLPDAVAVLDPKRDDCNYPYDELCGCGIGFKLIQALGKNRNQTIEDLTEYLDLVATAIAADIVPMTGENRTLAKFGMDVINSSPRPGIKALLQSIKKKEITITDVVFTVAPRINAAGRIKHGDYAVRLLTEFNLAQAEEFAKEIEDNNNERKGLDKQITKEALSQIIESKEEKRFTTVVYQEDWHKGVIGIVASRLIEQHFKPTIVFAENDGFLTGSARTVNDFDIHESLTQCADLLVKFGGHTHAAGLTIEKGNIEIFKKQLKWFKSLKNDSILEL